MCAIPDPALELRVAQASQAQAQVSNFIRPILIFLLFLLIKF